MIPATAIKERPIPFSAPMVRTLLAGTKTQTRRIIKDLDHAEQVKLRIDSHGGLFTYIGDLGDGHDDEPDMWMPVADGFDHVYGCPYGRPGARLWVREAIALNYSGHGKHGYRADWTSTAADVCSEPKWTPSIHMPRSASRITLEITDVRVQRLQDISDYDVANEGITERGGWWEGATHSVKGTPKVFNRPVDAFHDLWDSINGPGAWDLNPWVWALTFKRVTP